MTPKNSRATNKLYSVKYSNASECVSYSLVFAVESEVQNLDSLKQEVEEQRREEQEEASLIHSI